MSKKGDSMLRLVAVLGLFCLLAGLLLGFVHNLTEKPIEEASRRQLVSAVAEVLPAFDNNPVADSCMVTLDLGQSLKVYPARSGDSLVGLAVESESMDGFSGEIKVLFGFDSQGVVTGFQVLSHAETPGLGAKMQEWFSSPEGRRSVVGFDMTVGKAYVTKDGGDIDGITAATITSRAFTGALRLAYEAFQKYQSKSGK